MLNQLIASGLLAMSLGQAVASPNNILARATCNADNCARAVTGSKNPVPTATRRAICSAFLATTISYNGGFFGEPTQTIYSSDPESLPTYAADKCNYDVERFDSACACWGVARTTQTVLPFDCDSGPYADDNGCTYTRKCFQSVSGTSLDYNVGLGSELQCSDFCDQREECYAASYFYSGGDCVLYGKDYQLVPSQYQYYALVRANQECTGPNNGDPFGKQ